MIHIFDFKKKKKGTFFRSFNSYLFTFQFFMVVFDLKKIPFLVSFGIGLIFWLYLLLCYFIFKWWLAYPSSKGVGAEKANTFWVTSLDYQKQQYFFVHPQNSMGVPKKPTLVQTKTIYPLSTRNLN